MVKYTKKKKYIGSGPMGPVTSNKVFIPTPVNKTPRPAPANKPPPPPINNVRAVKKLQKIEKH